MHTLKSKRASGEIYNIKVYYSYEEALKDLQGINDKYKRKGKHCYIQEQKPNGRVPQTSL